MTLPAGPKKIERAFLCYPPVGLFQRGEERCQADIEGSTTQAPHAPNDLGYIAAVLKKSGVECVLRDYPAAGETESRALEEIRTSCPDMLLISTTTPTFPEDVTFLKKVKSSIPGIITVAKGSCFYSLPLSELEKNAYDCLDLAIYGESEFIISGITESLKDGSPLGDLGGLVIDIGSKNAARTRMPDFVDELDSLPFPTRDLIDNNLYKNPLTGRPMATIIVSRGCPSQCIFCLTPLISGQKLRKRSVQNVLGEIKECVKTYGITDFFFRADTFTMDRGYVRELCKGIKEAKLGITWVANSRTDVVDEDLLKTMKEAGCVLVAFGIESGNDEMQKKIRKNAMANDARRAVGLCRRIGLKTLGFFIIGFPWDTEETIKDTYDLMKELDCDFIEVHIAMPFEGTELNAVCRELGLIKEALIGYNYFSNPYGAGTLYLSRERLIEFRKKMIRDHYFRISYIFRRLMDCRSIHECANYFRYGFRLAGNILNNRCQKR